MAPFNRGLYLFESIYDMTERFDKHVLKNGMTILGEHMGQVGSVAFTFQLPCGAAQFKKGCCGAGAIITDWIFRGAGDMDSRALIDALDGLGLHRNCTVSAGFLSMGAAMEASSLEKAISLYSDVILHPTLEAKQFELSKMLAANDIISLDDDPRSKVMMTLREQFYPKPLGSPAMGKLEDVQSMTVDQVTAIIKQRFNLSKSTFAIAGKYNFDTVVKQLESLFDSEQPEIDTTITTGETGDKYTHIQHKGAQVHIGLMTSTVTVQDPNYYNAMAAVSVLSGGMSSRLFTEVREKRGLCYAVGANYNGLKQAAGISCYAGTTPDKAQETIDVIIAEFDKLGKDITESEIARAKVGLKSSLIMQSESSSSRANGIAGDHYLLGRVRGIEEIKENLEKVSVETVSNFLKNNKFDGYTVVTIGPESVKV